MCRCSGRAQRNWESLTARPLSLYFLSFSAVPFLKKLVFIIGCHLFFMSRSDIKSQGFHNIHKFDLGVSLGFPIYNNLQMGRDFYWESLCHILSSGVGSENCTVYFSIYSPLRLSCSRPRIRRSANQQSHERTDLLLFGGNWHRCAWLKAERDLYHCAYCFTLSHNNFQLSYATNQKFPQYIRYPDLNPLTTWNDLRRACQKLRRPDWRSYGCRLLYPEIVIRFCICRETQKWKTKRDWLLLTWPSLLCASQFWLCYRDLLPRAFVWCCEWHKNLRSVL